MDAAEVECLCTKILENIRTNDGKNADLLICDSKNIEQYIKKEYEKYYPKTTFIAYGTEIRKSQMADSDEKLKNGMQREKFTLSSIIW